MKRLAEQTLYEVLEVPPDAGAEAIEAAVERARMLYGPGSLATYTLMTPEESALLARRIEEARETLLDPELRPLYDEEIGRERATPANGAAARAAPVAPVSPAPPWPTPPVIPPIRAAMPFLPPDEEEDEDVEDEDREEDALDAHAADPIAPARPAPAPVEPAVAAAAEPAPELTPTTPGRPAEADEQPPAAPPAPQPSPARAPILLNREVATAPAAPAAPPGPTPTPVPGPAMTPVPGLIATPVPMVQPPPAPPMVPDQTLWTGEVLRQIREARGITLQQLAERTKVTRHHIENIEADRYGLLPAPVYLRGILMSLARELRLDGQKVARSYLERFTMGAASPAPPGRGR